MSADDSSTDDAEDSFTNGSDDSFTDTSGDSADDALGTLQEWYEEASTREDGPDLDELSARERGALKRARAMATFLDDAIPVPVIGYRVGADPILSIAPVSGDLAGAALSMHIVAEAARLGVPPKTLALMVGDVAVDTITGSVPVAGTLFDAVWKANRRNVARLESHLENRTEVPVE
ncbi:DUF4112 domain-containing protein [Halococcus saccharolyticus]|uniref:DUF4112 domain-containing protein n=1 Tax=Halococcus saccharolyticus DSM 5350 TaxID=1227455 RepID=M0MEM3_9EURY|nr:DUF4112 domain-containing protein [Halococcus saccharolyticus]EMA44176.1 hypothetical protein C449_11638 [Halococcus saccharolyticus DSM 5350]